jgi:hypothetical protein
LVFKAFWGLSFFLDLADFFGIAGWSPGGGIVKVSA